MNAKIGFTALFCLLIALANAQTWAHAQTFGGPGEETIVRMKTDSGLPVYVSGTYNQAFSWNGIQGLPVGSGDVFLARIDPDGQPVWMLAGGSADADNARGLALRPDGGAYWGGAFWDEAYFGDWTGTAPGGGRSLFLLSVSPSGHPDWGKVFYGAGVKEIRDLHTDDAGNLYAAGYFGGQLFIDDTLLQAQGALDGFAAKWNVAGELQWAMRFGEAGNVWAESLAFREPNGLYLGGRFNGALSLAGTSIQSNTFDDDGFVAAFSADTGEAIWLRKAGAQYDDAVTGLALNQAGDLFAAGTFVGVLQVAPGWNILTAGFNTNFFLIRYDALDGAPVWAQSLGNLTDEQCLGIGIRNEGPVISGLFRGSLTLGGQSVSAQGPTFNGFAAGFHPDGALRWLAGIPGEGLVLPEALAVDGDGAVWLAGGFNQTLYFDDTPFSSNGGFDAWMGRLKETITPVREAEAFSGRVFPNPVSDLLYFEGFAEPFSFQVFGADGVLRLEGAHPVQAADMRPLEAGVYILSVQSAQGKIFFKVIKM